ncbi:MULTISPECIES: thioredoxin [Dellaglioa]|uniref:Thioredoxin n=3 Tax=Dellaglioa TaxID=2767880 RepID=A0A0R1HQ60_9LACO|nr:MULTISPECIES: thioredoxin [Dellaglioa]KRK45410.1 Thiol-disulfide isomerase and thioredoxin [Dellaglioa algida DSM 15638]MCZ2491865.1 thioredoxin [Dellaglioa carnosa]MCZ2492934.1 thioredoxin [Dellaglioa carnosa]MCZ2494919.1 thioredoxin [Dellaglioa carnosa]MDK1717290.1 thioredoxin [Dellaglioa algida]
MVQAITDKEFETVTDSGVTLTDFWATWCGPCRMQTPAIEELEQEMGETVKFSKMDIDQNPATAQSFGIMSIPTLMIKKDGEVVDTIVGYHSKDQVKEVLAKYI